MVNQHRVVETAHAARSAPRRADTDVFTNRATTILLLLLVLLASVFGYILHHFGGL